MLFGDKCESKIQGTTFGVKEQELVTTIIVNLVGADGKILNTFKMTGREKTRKETVSFVSRESQCFPGRSRGKH